MSDNATDEAFARALDQMGATTPQYIEAAKAAQAEAAGRGRVLTLAEVMVEQNIITRAMRESIEQRLQTRASGGIKTLGQHELLKKTGESLHQGAIPWFGLRVAFGAVQDPAGQSLQTRRGRKT